METLIYISNYLIIHIKVLINQGSIYRCYIYNVYIMPNF